MPHTWFLVPGYGAQGGGAADVQDAFDASGLGAVVNNSRAIIFAYQRPEYAALGAGELAACGRAGDGRHDRPAAGDSGSSRS